MVEQDVGCLEKLSAFIAHFRGAFRRRDQARWAAVYLQGLLTTEGRKTINCLARRVVLPPDLTVDDAAQALQNFVNQSPWDEQTVWRRYRAWTAERLAAPEAVFVVSDLTFVKQGRHSVGVQRQYSSALGRKTNCQIAVALHCVGAAGCFPLSLRLYLPRAWLQQTQRLDAAGVPHEHRRVSGKGAIALDLLDEARKEGWAGQRLLGGAGYGSDRAFREGLIERGFTYLQDASANKELAVGETHQPMAEGHGWVGNCSGGPDATLSRPHEIWRAVAEA